MIRERDQHQNLTDKRSPSPQFLYHLFSTVIFQLNSTSSSTFSLSNHRLLTFSPTTVEFSVPFTLITFRLPPVLITTSYFCLLLAPPTHSNSLTRSDLPPPCPSGAFTFSSSSRTTKSRTDILLLLVSHRLAFLLNRDNGWNKLLLNPLLSSKHIPPSPSSATIKTSLWTCDLARNKNNKKLPT